MKTGVWIREVLITGALGLVNQKLFSNNYQFLSNNEVRQSTGAWQVFIIPIFERMIAGILTIDSND